MAMGSAARWLVWVGGTLATVPISCFVWWFWGMAFCGEEVYDTKGDVVCSALVEPIWPWAVIAATPTLITLVVGLAALRTGSRVLFRFALVAPVAIGVLTLFMAPAIF